MLHTKFHGNRSAGSEKNFEGGRGGYLGYVTKMPLSNFSSTYPWRIHKKNWLW